MAVQGLSATWHTVEELKRALRDDGFVTKAVLSDEEMRRATALVRDDERALETPPDELRYIEGLFSLPLGYIPSFVIVPQRGYEQCRCGRTPSALDIVHFAYAKHVHSRDLIRDTLLGYTNVFEIAEGEGRVAECYLCARPMVVARYTRHASYMYA